MTDAGELLQRDVPIIRVRGAVALADATQPGAGEIRDAAVLVQGGRVVAVGPAASADTMHPEAFEIGGDDFWILPGLVNAHTHGRGVGWFRLGALDDALEPWIYSLMGQPGLDPYRDTVYQNLRLIEAGVTSALHSHYPRNPTDPDELEATIGAYRDTGLRVGFAVSLFTQNFLSYDDQRFLTTLPKELCQRIERVFGTGSAPNSDAAFAQIRQLARQYQESGNGRTPSIRILHGPVAPQWVTPEELQRCRREADELGGGVHMHVLETPYQWADGRRKFAQSWGVALDELGVLGPNVSVAHAVWSEDADLACFADRGVTVCHNPSSNLRLKNGIAPVLRMRERGVRVALGGDNSTLGGEEDPFIEMRLCANLQRQPGFDGAVLAPEEVLAMATVAGGVATGFGDRIGRLTPGAAADLVLLRHAPLTRPHVADSIPVVANLLHAGSARQVETVMIDGRVVYHAGRHRGFDKAKLEDELRAQAAEPASAALQEVQALFRDLTPHRRRFEEQLFPEPAHYQYNVHARGTQYP